MCSSKLKTACLSSSTPKNVYSINSDLMKLAFNLNTKLKFSEGLNISICSKYIITFETISNNQQNNHRK